MTIEELQQLIDELPVELRNTQVRLVFSLENPDEFDGFDEIRKIGFSTHLESSAHSKFDLVIKDRSGDGDVGSTRDESLSS